jgi:hypothetical protein
MLYFDFTVGEKVIWAGSTVSIYVEFISIEEKPDGKEWALVKPIDTFEGEYSGEYMYVPADELIPDFDVI